MLFTCGRAWPVYFVQTDMEIVERRPMGAAINLVRDLRPTCLMDIVPGRDSGDAHNTEMPDVQIIGLSMFEEEQAMACALRGCRLYHEERPFGRDQRHPQLLRVCDLRVY
jgi:hypothetical protein